MNMHIDYTTLTTNKNKSTESQLHSFYDSRYKIEWCYMRPSSRPCFNFNLVNELNAYYAQIKSGAAKANGMQYQVMASDIPGVFSLGGDLKLFKKLIEAKDKAALKKYAYACIETIFSKSSLHKQSITHISLVQGDALGGGFEAALAADLFIAEKGTKLGFPEVLFNWFPGMGAYPFLSRRIGSDNAEKMILSGKIYTAEALYDMGVIDILAENGEGAREVYDYVQNNETLNPWQPNNHHQSNPVSYKELADITDAWIEKSMHLSPRNLRFMEKLVSRQNLKLTSIAA